MIIKTLDICTSWDILNRVSDQSSTFLFSETCTGQKDITKVVRVILDSSGMNRLLLELLKSRWAPMAGSELFV